MGQGRTGSANAAMWLGLIWQDGVAASIGCPWQAGLWFVNVSKAEFERSGGPTILPLGKPDVNFSASPDKICGQQCE